MSPSNTLLISDELREANDVNGYFVFVDLDEYPVFMDEYDKMIKKKSTHYAFENLATHLIEYIRAYLMGINRYYSFLGFDIAFIKSPSHFINTGVILEHCKFYKI